MVDALDTFQKIWCMKSIRCVWYEQMEKVAENVIYEVWYTFSEKLFARIVEVTGLSEEQAEALRAVVLRPNDFVVEIVDGE